MTEFEKNIKRGMTKERFEKIRDYRYGDGVNTFDYTYGNVSSWLTWNRDSQGRLLHVKPPKPEYDSGGHLWDGPMAEWQESYAKTITTDIVFLGLNMSGDGSPKDRFVFQNARGAGRIIKTFFGTAAEGAYFTDIIKPDKRFLEEIGRPANSREVNPILKRRPEIMKEHIRLFLEELDFIGADKPLLILFGNDAEWAFNDGLEKRLIDKKRFHAVIKITHYSLAAPVYGDYPAHDKYLRYKLQTREKLREYLTIPDVIDNKALNL